MAKWYRLSLSLASKCRVGFAAAVFLIIGAALFLPYRWMDKLVEQGKIELAQAEMQHVLERHFRPAKNMESLAALPPLALTADTKNRTVTARWQFVESNNNIDQSRETYTVVSAPINQSGQSSSAPSPLLQQRPLTQWFALQPEINQLALLLEPASETTLNQEQSTGPPVPLTKQQKDVKDKIEKLLNALIDDPFIIEGIQDYLFSTNIQETFQLHRPARYLRGVWAARDCLTSGCHSNQKTIDTETASQNLPSPFIEGQLVGVISVSLPPGQTGPTLLFNRLFIIVGGFIAGLCAMITFYLITQRFILRPVRNLRRAADQVTVPTDPETGESSESLDSWQRAIQITSEIKTGDEFERLAEAFHHMLTRLRKAQDELRETNQALDLQVDKLAEQNVALYEANRLKSEFLANVSHELRTPLNAIIGFTEILKEKVNPEEDQKQSRYIDNVLSAGKMLHGVINDLLDLAKIEAGKMQANWSQCSITEIVEVLINFTRPMAQQKQLDVYLNIDDRLSLVESDPGKLQQIFFNLINNAIKFTPKGGRIDINVAVVDEIYFEFAVTDTGPGIPPEDHEIIFEKFRQLDGSVTREHTGTGLGLAIVKELVGMLGGTIRLKSQLGQGARFTVILPKNKLNITSLPQLINEPQP